MYFSLSIPSSGINHIFNENNLECLFQLMSTVVVILFITSCAHVSQCYNMLTEILEYLKLLKFKKIYYSNFNSWQSYQ